MAQHRPIPVLLDVDTGTDDALALMLACASDRFDIRGVTTIGGNVGLEATTRNTLNVLKLLGREDIPVAKGAEKPLVRPAKPALPVHELRGYSFAGDATRALTDLPAWELMRQTLESSSEPVTLIALAPATNLALLLEKYPAVKEKIDKIVFMGSSYHDGNPTPLATFNVLADPEAFRRLLFSGVDLYALPLDTGRGGFLFLEELTAIGEMQGEVAKMTFGMLTGGALPTEERRLPCVLDAITVAFAAYPEHFAAAKYYCDVECKGELTTGFTLVDKRDYYQKSMEERNLYFIESMDRDAYGALFLRAVRSYGG